MLPTDNIALTLAGPDPELWLERVDLGVQSTFDALTRRGRFYEAFLCLGAHYEKTETVRSQAYGPAPSLEDAIDRFRAACDRQMDPQMDTVRAFLGVPRYQPETDPDPMCNHRRGPWTCQLEAHPDHPNGHYYVSCDGSHVPDRHTTGTS